MSTSRTMLHTILALLLLVAAFGGYLFLLVTIKDAHADVTARRLLALEERERADTSFLTERSLRQHKSKLETLAGYFVEEADIPQFISSLEGVSKEAGVTMHLASLSAETKETPALSLALAVDGKYTAVTKFLEALELLPLRLRVTSVTLSKVNSATGEGLPTPTTRGREDTWQAAVQFTIMSFHPKLIAR